jgi:anti-sigma-K factor RskA
VTGTGEPDPDDPDLRAAEYVLGTLDAGERAAFAREAARDPAVQARIRAWERRLGPLAETVAAETPPPRVRAALLQALPAPGHADARQIDVLRAQLRR